MFLITRTSQADRERPETKIVFGSNSGKAVTKRMYQYVKQSLMKYGYEEKMVLCLIDRYLSSNKEYVDIKIDENELGCLGMINGKCVYYYDKLIGDVFTLHSIKV